MPVEYKSFDISRDKMMTVLLWGSKDVPTVDKWVVYNPVRAAMANDPFIPDLRKVLQASEYLHQYASKAIMLDLVEPIFFVIPFIDRVEDGTYVIKSLVKLKPKEIQDFDVEIYSNETDFNRVAKNYTDADRWLEFTHAIQTERRTTDKMVETFYYPKEVIDVIESY